MVFFRKIFILQLLGLVLTYNFTDCNFENIREEYQRVIFNDLKSHVRKTKRTLCHDCVYCENRPDCLAKIERLTFYPTHGCTSLAQEIFAVKTEATLTLQCPGYSGIQTNNIQTMKKRKKREDVTNECWKVISVILGLWRRFTRF